MAIVFQSAQTVDQNAGGASITINKPASTAQNDLLVAFLDADGNPGTITAPTGWTQWKQTDEGAGQVSGTAYYKVAGASEPANYAWSVVGRNIYEGAIGRYTGEDTVHPDDQVAPSGNGATSGGTLTANTITTTTDHDFDVCWACTGNATSLTFNGSGYSQDVNFGGGGDLLQVQDKAISPAGATGNQTWTQSPTTGGWIAQQLAIKPAAAAAAQVPYMPYGRQPFLAT